MVTSLSVCFLREGRRGPVRLRRKQAAPHLPWFTYLHVFEAIFTAGGGETDAAAVPPSSFLFVSVFLYSRVVNSQQTGEFSHLLEWP